MCTYGRGTIELEDLELLEVDDAELRGLAVGDAGAEPGTELEPEWRIIHRVADGNLERTARLFDRAFRAGRRAVNLAELEEAIAAGSQFQALQLCLAGADRTLEILEEELAPLTLEILGAAGEAVAARARAAGTLFRDELIEQELPPEPGPTSPLPAEPTVAQEPIELDFFTTNPRATNWAAEHSGRLIVEIDGATRRAIQQIIADGFEQGLPPRVMARRIRPLVGLTSRQARAVSNLRERLATEGLGRGAIDRAAARYARRLHRGRVLNIARTETIDSASEGQRQLWLQAREQGLLTGTEKREWIVTPDDRLCPICRRMAGQVRGLEEPFDTGVFGRVMGPTAHPQCRCATGLVRGDAAGAGDGTPTLPSGAPITPPGVLPGGGPPPAAAPGARLSWLDFTNAKLPKAAERRELLENSLNVALDSVPPALRAQLIDVIEETPNYTFKIATKSTKNIAAVGRMTATAPNVNVAPRLERLMLHMSRPNGRAIEWSRGYQAESKRLVALRDSGQISGQEMNRLLGVWRERNPFPEAWRLATDEEVAGTLIHELAHALDFKQGTSIGLDPLGLTRKWRADGMQQQIWRAYYRGQVDVSGNVIKPLPGATKDPRFSYATTKGEEGLAETMRLYFMGDQDIHGVQTLTAEQFREQYPELAGWIQRNIVQAAEEAAGG